MVLYQPSMYLKTVEYTWCIAEHKLQNELVDVLFKFSIEKYLRGDFTYSRSTKILSELDKEESIYQFFQLFLTIESIEKDSYYDVINAIIEKQESIINFSSRIFQQLLQIAMNVSWGNRNSIDIQNTIVSYLKRMKQELKAINILLEISEEIWRVKHLIVKLIKERQLDEFITLLLNSGEKLDGFSHIAHCIYYNRRELSDSFLEKANHFLDNKLEIIIDDTQKQKKRNEQIEHELTLEALFDKDKFIIEVEKIFGEHQFLDEVWKKDTWKNKRAYSRFIIRFLYGTGAYKKRVFGSSTKAEVVEYVEKHWECCKFVTV